MSADVVRELAGARVLVCADEGVLLAGEADVAAFLGAAWEGDAAWLALPSSRLGPDFFRLRSGLAGAAAQKFVTHRIGLAIVGDLSSRLAGSETLRDFVREANRGRAIWFVDDLAGLERRLTAGGATAEAAAR